jgi:glutathione S-transferase
MATTAGVWRLKIPNATRGQRLSFEYIGVDDAIQRPGLRMVVVGGIPSPWGEAAKGLFHLKGLDWAAVRLDYTSDTMKQWTGGRRDGPVAVFNDEPPRHTWDQILLLAERLAPEPALLPPDPAERALAMGLAHEICAEGGLGWTRRLQLIHAGLAGGGASGGFPPKVASYLARKYGYRPEDAPRYGPRVTGLLDMLTARLRSQHAAGQRCLLGDKVTAVDVYSAAFMALFKPLPEAHCAMDPATRRAFETLDATTAQALSPELLAHRDWMYERWLGLPLQL